MASLQPFRLPCYETSCGKARTLSWKGRSRLLRACRSIDLHLDYVTVTADAKSGNGCSATGHQLPLIPTETVSLVSVRREFIIPAVACLSSLKASVPHLP